jgi:membrane-associated protease RseP (regulator of RpoE activity)
MSREFPRPGVAFPAHSDSELDIWARGGLPEPESEPDRVPPDPRTNLFLFLATVPCVFLAGVFLAGTNTEVLMAAKPGEFLVMLLGGWKFAVPFLTILLVHEFGHYIAARIHRVDASLPYFLPLPLLSPFGTMGAVIAMRGRIRSRDALLDIGASGPLAGLVVAIPVLVYGLSLSTVSPLSHDHYMQEGQSLLYLAMKRAVLGPIPDGMDVNLHPTAFAGWGGLLITMINLFPWGQLDGGHVAYALLGHRHHALARWFRRALLVLYVIIAAEFIGPVLLGHSSMPLLVAFTNSFFWLMWYLVMRLIGRFSNGEEHPATEPGELSPTRKVIAVVTLAFFVLLFMPVPLAQY